MLLIGCSLKNRHVEQHDVFFGIGDHIKDILPQAIASWPEAGASFHLDAWREVTIVDGKEIEVHEGEAVKDTFQLFFINLGGYKKGEFEEFHYKMLVTAKDKNEAMRASKQTAFFRHTGFKGATAHIDDKYGVDVDNIYSIRDILPAGLKEKFTIRFKEKSSSAREDTIHLGYFRPGKVDDWGDI